MRFEFVYGRTRAELDEEVEKKLADGWKMFTGEVHTIPSGMTCDKGEVPNFVYFARSVIKEASGAN